MRNSTLAVLLFAVVGCSEEEPQREMNEPVVAFALPNGAVDLEGYLTRRDSAAILVEEMPDSPNAGGKRRFTLHGRYQVAIGTGAELRQITVQDIPLCTKLRVWGGPVGFDSYPGMQAAEFIWVDSAEVHAGCARRQATPQ